MPSARLRFQPGVGLLLMSRLVRQVRTIGCLYLVLYCAGATNARAQDFRGALRGVVQDSNGGRVPAAKISLHAAESSFQREIGSDSRGEFRIGDLLPGTYRAKVQASVFAETDSNAKLTVSSLHEIIRALKTQARLNAITP